MWWWLWWCVSVLLYMVWHDHLPSHTSLSGGFSRRGCAPNRGGREESGAPHVLVCEAALRVCEFAPRLPAAKRRAIDALGMMQQLGLAPAPGG